MARLGDWGLLEGGEGGLAEKWYLSKCIFCTVESTNENTQLSCASLPYTNNRISGETKMFSRDNL